MRVQLRAGIVSYDLREIIPLSDEIKGVRHE